MAEVKLYQLTKRFNEVTAVQGVNLEIKDGEFLVLVGPSGCGKTTILRMIAGLEEVTSGEIYIGDRLVNDLPPKDRDIAMVFQNYALYPHMSVYENMAFGLKMRHTPKAEIERRVQEAADILGISHLLRRKPRELSGGQRQRVALGRAIVREPKVFLMDEPLSNLDAKLRVQTRAELVKLHRRLGVTTIYVTHDQVEAMTMGERIAIIKDGVIQQVDTPLRLYNHPQNIFVAGFIGSPPMNFCEGRLLKKEGEYLIQTKSFSLKIKEYNTSLPKPWQKSLEEYEGKEIIIGIRPENVLINKDKSRPLQMGEDKEVSAESFLARVEVVEPMGNEVIVYLSIQDINLIAKSPPDYNLKIGEEYPITLDIGKIHFFDKETERVIGGEVEDYLGKGV